jgi:hypothetical protein
MRFGHGDKERRVTAGNGKAALQTLATVLSSAFSLVLINK